MISNTTVFQISPQWIGSAELLEAAFAPHTFEPCGASQEKSVGWIPPRGEKHGALVENVNGQWIAKLRIDTRSVPGSAIKTALAERIEKIQAQTGRTPGKKEKKEITEDIRLSMLPMAFTKESATLVWFNPATRYLVIDTASQARADEVATWLIKAIDGLVIAPISTQTSPASAMAGWLSTQEPPAGFTIDRDCELKASDESKSVVRYRNHALDTVEVSQHIAQGKVPTHLGLTWEERVSFILSEGLVLKKIQFVDVNASDKGHDGDAFDGDVALMTGYLTKMIPDVLLALGGEIKTAFGTTGESNTADTSTNGQAAELQTA